MGKINTNIKKLFQSLVADESGNAIILALIIIAGLAGTGIGAARLTKSNTTQATVYEDSLKAYYAAEAGVESALLEWRFDHDVEFWDRDEALACFDDEDNSYDHCDAAKVRRYVMLGSDEDATPTSGDLASRFDQNGNLKDGYSLPKNQAWYEMQIYYRDPKNPYLGNVSTTDITQPWVTNDFYPETSDLPRIGKDETMEVSWPASDEVKRVYIYWSADLGVADGNNFSRLLVHPVKIDGSDAELVDVKNVTDEVFYTGEEYGKRENKKWDYVIKSVPGYEYEALKSVRIKCLSNVDSYPLGDYI